MITELKKRPGPSKGCRVNGGKNTIRIIKSRKMRWTGYLAGMGEKRNAYRILVGKPETKRPLGKLR
jgi:hypothetical protein